MNKIKKEEKKCPQKYDTMDSMVNVWESCASAGHHRKESGLARRSNRLFPQLSLSIEI